MTEDAPDSSRDPRVVERKIADVFASLFTSEPPTPPDAWHVAAASSSEPS
jgi:hypothetical protein